MRLSKKSEEIKLTPEEKKTKDHLVIGVVLVFIVFFCLTRSCQKPKEVEVTTQTESAEEADETTPVIESGDSELVSYNVITESGDVEDNTYYSDDNTDVTYSYIDNPGYPAIILPAEMVDTLGDNIDSFLKSQNIYGRTINISDISANNDGSFVITSTVSGEENTLIVQYDGTYNIYFSEG